jgi:hypothetical protein
LAIGELHLCEVPFKQCFVGGVTVSNSFGKCHGRDTECPDFTSCVSDCVDGRNFDIVKSCVDAVNLNITLGKDWRCNPVQRNH